MYAPYFGLKHEPFSIAPDPRYLFMSERHREALAHLLYGIGGGGGFVLLSGEIGAGKTTVCRCLLEQIPPNTNVAYIFNPKLTVVELLQSVCDEFGVQPRTRGVHGRTTIKDYLDPLNEFLLASHAAGRNNVLIIDEAQMLSGSVLEQLRLLTNLETNERKLLQIMLIGQPELRDLLARPELEQLAQRVIARYHLDALTPPETERYIRHRLSVAGMTAAFPFDAKSIQRIHQLSRGVPRRINLLCDRALLGAYAGGRPRVDRAIVDKAAGEVFDGDRASMAPPGGGAARPRWWMGGLGAVAVAAVVLLVVIGLAQRRDPGAAAVAASGAASSKVAGAASGAASASSSAPAVGRTAALASAPVASPPPTYLTAADLRSRFDPLTRDERDAWRALAPAWKLATNEADPCAAAQRSDVQCYRSASSTLALIRQLDRPGILALRDENDKPIYALLTGLTADTATLKIGRTSQTLALISLASLWRGDFATFWRSPVGYAGKPIDAGAGPAAVWLGRQLATLDGQPVPATEAEWRARVSAFQLAQGLKPDGLAGPTTFMQLNRATGVDEPRLTRGAGNDGPSRAGAAVMPPPTEPGRAASSGGAANAAAPGGSSVADPGATSTADRYAASVR